VEVASAVWVLIGIIVELYSIYFPSYFHNIPHPPDRASEIAAMADIPSLPKSPTLQPPRKSVELEDPGAHDLGGSEHSLRAHLVNHALTFHLSRFR